MDEINAAGPGLDLAGQTEAHTRLELVKKAVERWRKQLIDTSGRNKLLRFRHLKTGTLDLTPSPDGVSGQTLQDLAAGSTVALRDLVPHADLQSDAARRIRSIRKTAQIGLEEKGIDTLFLVLGFAQWRQDGPGVPPFAPVILVPTTIRPDGAAQQSFKLSATGDPHFSPVLLHVLSEEHGARELVERAVAQVLQADEFSFRVASDLFRRLTEDLEHIPQFRIKHQAALGNFSYATMPMVEDLGANVELLAENDIVAAVAGDAGARTRLAEKFIDPDRIDLDSIDPRDEFLILDADASQQRAIERVIGGESIVVQGPPGTGKSQTISNLIGSLIARGKRVLFVAEKRAAIEAVIERIDRAGLSDLVLDLHGGVTNKRKFAEQLAVSLRSAASTPLPDYAKLQQNLAVDRESLSGFAHRLHAARPPWGLSHYEIQARILGVSEAARTEHRLTPDASNRMSDGKLDHVRDLLAEWIHLGGHSVQTDYPEWSEAAIATPDDASAAYEAVRQLAVGTEPEAARDVTAMLAAVGLEQPASVAGWQDMIEFLRRLEAFAAEFDLDLLEANLSELLTALELGGRGGMVRMWASLANGNYRDAKRNVSEHAHSAKRVSGRRAQASVIEANALHEAWFEAARDGARPVVPEELSLVADRVDRLVSELAALGAYLTTSSWVQDDRRDLEARLQRLARQREVVAKIPRVREIERELSDCGLAEILNSVRTGSLAYTLTAEVFEHAWLQTVLDELSFSDTEIAAFSGARHDATVDAFQAGDRAHLRSATQRIRRAAAENLYAAMSEHQSEAALVQAQAGRKRGHLPVRRLFAQSPHVMSALRPCWTMSPLLVSELVPADGSYFDVVIFDEASQITPAEAIASLARAPQAVVAGDSKQLPPTTFFSKMVEEEEDDEEAALALTSSDYESILDVLAAGPFRETMLLWHYRSRDERLINFSNAHLYLGGLTTFPGAIGADCLQSVLIPHRPIVGSSTRSNLDEVERVAELVLDHARATPEMSLGVIAMGQAHASNIEEALRRRIVDLDDRALDEFFSEEAAERFFVKNIERVQGDERDAIILSIGYHKKADGSLPYRFGPLLYEGGERRLNVAITRARSRLTLVSSFDSRDMPPGKSKARGVELLRQYFDYVRSSGEDLGSVPTETPLNPIELHVARVLSAKGMPLTPQYGVSGYKIDFAVAHPDRLGQMVLAIEADGASYHSSESARERDRLRQEVLENLGWRVHRIWSTEWFRDPEREAERALSAWSEAVATVDGRVVQESTSMTIEDDLFEPETSTRRGTRPYILRGEPITTYSTHELLRIVEWVASDTLLRTDEELHRETMEVMGYRRRGSRIDAALSSAIRSYRARHL